MKKIILILLLVFAVFTLTACDDDDDTQPTRTMNQSEIENDDLLTELSNEIKGAFK